LTDVRYAAIATELPLGSDPPLCASKETFYILVAILYTTA
jgi:hypothetical protein